ncbi:MAG: leucine-rich repeat protein [Eubacteriales bacterium]
MFEKILILSLLLILSSGTSKPIHTESPSSLPEAVSSPAAAFSQDFAVEYDENGRAILTKYCGPGGDVVIPDGINMIGKHVFDLLTYTDERVITSIYIPDTVTIIDDYAFLCCYRLEDGLREIRMSSKIEYIGTSAFDNCVYLETIQFDSIPQHTVSIGEQAFAYCNSLKEIQLPASILLGSDVFVGTALEEDYSAKYNSLIPPLTSPEPLLPNAEDMEIVPEIVCTENDNEKDFLG